MPCGQVISATLFTTGNASADARMNKVGKSICSALIVTALVGLSAVTAADKLVDAKGGLKVRQEPDAKGKVITTLKDGSTVAVLEETGDPVMISGQTGKWTKINAGSITGWVFGGFLVSDIPKSLWGYYCTEGNPKCGQASYFIDGQMVWQSSEGGCGLIEKVEKNGDEHHVYCDGKLGVTLKPLSKGRLPLTITGQPSVILKKEKWAGI